MEVTGALTVGLGAECLGTMYQADPVWGDDAQKKTLPLELLSITFHAQYYSTSQGKSDERSTINSSPTSR